MRCAETPTCEEVDLCPPCFIEGKSIGKHRPWHPYRVIEQHSYPIFTDDWGADEYVENNALESSDNSHFQRTSIIRRVPIVWIG